MDKMPLVILLFYALPEGLLANSVGLILMGVRPVLKKMLELAFLFAVSAFFLRSFLSPGLHSIILTVVSSLYIFLLFRVSYLKALSAAMLAFVFVVLGEALFTSLVLSATGLSVEHVMQNPWLRILVTLPQQLFLGLAAYVSYRIRGFHTQKNSYRAWG